MTKFIKTRWGRVAVGTQLKELLRELFLYISRCVMVAFALKNVTKCVLNSRGRTSQRVGLLCVVEDHHVVVGLCVSVI